MPTLTRFVAVEEGRTRGFVSRQTAIGLVAGAAAIGVVSAVIAGLKPHIDPVGLTGLYLFAILPVAIVWGFWVAGVVAIASYLTFSFFFVPPVHHFAIERGDPAAGLAISIVAAMSSASSRGERPNAPARPSRPRRARAAGDEQRRCARRDAGRGGGADLGSLRGPPGRFWLQCDADLARMERSRPITRSRLAAWSRAGDAQLRSATRFDPRGHEHRGTGYETGRPARLDTFGGASADRARGRGAGPRSSVGCPIVVGGRNVGVVAASTRPNAVPPNTESRIADFTELVATRSRTPRRGPRSSPRGPC